MPLASHLILGSRWTFVGGKGGVGKTTVAAALAVELADAGEPVTVLSTDPAHSLGDALGLTLQSDPRPHPQLPALEAFELDPSRERADFLKASGDAIATLVERGTYLDSEDADAVTDLTLPGMDELAALLRLSRLANQGKARVIIDTAPTGHTLNLLDLPAVGLAWLGSLEAMQAKHEAMAAAFSGRPAAPDDASRFVDVLRNDLDRLAESFRNATETRFVLITNSDAAVVAETRRYRAELERRGIAIGGIILNRAIPDSQRDPTNPPGNAATDGDLVDLEIAITIPRLERIGSDLPSLRHVARIAVATARPGISTDEGSAAEEGLGAIPAKPKSPNLVVGPPYEVPAGRSMYLVGGKGGVGKTTVAAAIAVSLARSEANRILLLSVDPAGSLPEILGVPVAPSPEAVPELDGLFAQQIDAARAWRDFTARYRAEVEALFEGLGGPNVSATLDREVLDRLIDMAPPGVDELMAIMEVIDLLEDGEYDALVVDTAPTGHFLRLLELPELALEWTHAVLRLLLKYRSVMRLEGLGERILKLSRSLRSLRARLVDPEFTWVAIVALPETLSLPESARLVSGLRRLGIEPAVLLVNQAVLPGGEVVAARAEAITALLGIDPGIPAVATPLMRPPPTDRESLEAFRRAWRVIAPG